MKCQEWSDPSYVGAKKVQDSPCLFDLWYIIKCEKIEKNHWANKLVGLNISFFSGIAILVDLQLQFEAYLSPSPLWKKCPMSLLPVQSCPNLPHHTGHWISPRGFYIINHHISSLMSFIIHNFFMFHPFFSWKICPSVRPISRRFPVLRPGVLRLQMALRPRLHQAIRPHGWNVATSKHWIIEDLEIWG